MNFKALIIVFAILSAWAWLTKHLYDGKVSAEAENVRLDRELKTAISQSQLKAEAFAAREQSLINDRKELEHEYKKLLELRKTDKYLDAWSDGALPDCVSLLLQ